MPKAKKKPAKKHNSGEASKHPTPLIRATFPIVAIGASAVGLEAFRNLLCALPPVPGLALIFIPHLDPTHESAMVELLSRTPRLPVVQAAERLISGLYSWRIDLFA